MNIKLIDNHEYDGCYTDLNFVTTKYLEYSEMLTKLLAKEDRCPSYKIQSKHLKELRFVQTQVLIYAGHYEKLTTKIITTELINPLNDANPIKIQFAVN